MLKYLKLISLFVIFGSSLVFANPDDGVQQPEMGPLPPGGCGGSLDETAALPLLSAKPAESSPTTDTPVDLTDSKYQLDENEISAILQDFKIPGLDHYQIYKAYYKDDDTLCLRVRLRGLKKRDSKNGLEVSKTDSGIMLRAATRDPKIPTSPSAIFPILTDGGTLDQHLIGNLDRELGWNTEEENITLGNRSQHTTKERDWTDFEIRLSRQADDDDERRSPKFKEYYKTWTFSVHEGFFLGAITLKFKPPTSGSHSRVPSDRYTQRDALTGFKNATNEYGIVFFSDRINAARKNPKNGERKPQFKTFILHADLDGVGHSNESIGREATDPLFTAFGETFTVNTRPNDEGYKIGGDEFPLVLKGSNLTAEIARERASAIAADYAKHAGARLVFKVTADGFSRLLSEILPIQTYSELELKFGDKMHRDLLRLGRTDLNKLKGYLIANWNVAHRLRPGVGIAVIPVNEATPEMPTDRLDGAGLMTFVAGWLDNEAKKDPRFNAAKEESRRMQWPTYLKQIDENKTPVPLETPQDEFIEEEVNRTVKRVVALVPTVSEEDVLMWIRLGPKKNSSKEDFGRFASILGKTEEPTK